MAPPSAPALACPCMTWDDPPPAPPPAGEELIQLTNGQKRLHFATRNLCTATGFGISVYDAGRSTANTADAGWARSSIKPCFPGPILRISRAAPLEQGLACRCVVYGVPSLSPLLTVEIEASSEAHLQSHA